MNNAVAGHLMHAHYHMPTLSTAQRSVRNLGHCSMLVSSHLRFELCVCLLAVSCLNPAGAGLVQITSQ